MRSLADVPDGCIVVGYDGSGRARSALMWAAREAADRGLSLRLVTAMPYGDVSAGGIESILGAAAAGSNGVLGEGIRLARSVLVEDRVSGASVTGHPAGVLVEASEGATMVVVGQRAQDTLVSSAIGSTSLVLADRARCPVVVARGAAGPERAALPVVVGVTGDARSRAATDFAAYTAHIRRVPLTIVAAWSLPPAREWSRAPHAFETMAQLSRELSSQAAAAADAGEDHVRVHYPSLSIRTQVEQLDAATALERASQGAGLLVVGSGARSGEDRSRSSIRSSSGVGQVARVTLGRARCPVVVVPDVAATTLADVHARGAQAGHAGAAAPDG